MAAQLMGLFDWSAWLRRDIERQMVIPADFAHALGALRTLSEAAIHASTTEAWRAQSDAVALLERYVFDRATADEMHAASERARR